MDLFDDVAKVIIVLDFFAALAVATSPSGCAIACIAIGAIKIGWSISKPRILQDVLTFETSRNSLGRSSYLLKILLFLSRVISSLAQEP
tara:strand:- start:205 stop:471 length:267 start_codon:yes stop_codon:yes gene_type:complete